MKITNLINIYIYIVHSEKLSGVDIVKFFQTVKTLRHPELPLKVVLLRLMYQTSFSLSTSQS